ncbi:M20 family metallo-hydrolase [Hymenobacter sp. B81]|uniref:M20 family metallo-hydrolase n=1 Tax=Hymenobacter sp. B81 TaxID=3344878 RepID=UPI0037DCB8E5
MPELSALTDATTALLIELIRTPSFSREEGPTADLLVDFLRRHGAAPQRAGHNVWARNRHFDPAKPTILLNSHHDTVKPGASWTYDPFGAVLVGEQLIGLGSNDAGASAVSLLATFLHFQERADLAFNLICAITAEEEISGTGGIRSILPQLGRLDLGIVGEPTQMQLAVAEKGLVVLDCVAHGRSGHAARDEGENALYKAVDDISWLRSYQFPETSPLLGPVKMTVTQVQAGSQHNVVPDRCSFVVDVRTNECYSNEQVVATLRQHMQSEVTPRSTHLNSSGIAPQHPLVQRALALGRQTFGSATLSDQAVLPFATVKIGPGDSARSHTPDEYILLSELRAGIEGYINLLEGFSF